MRPTPVFVKLPELADHQRISTFWFSCVGLWICVILFSSTSLALRWAEHSFGFLSTVLFSGLPHGSSSYEIVHFLADKGFHVSLFCILAILLWKALLMSPHKALLILAIGAVVGCCSELLQRLFPDRDPAIRDVLINIGGTALGILCCLAVRKIRYADRRSDTFANRI